MQALRNIDTIVIPTNAPITVPSIFESDISLLASSRYGNDAASRTSRNTPTAG